MAKKPLDMYPYMANDLKKGGDNPPLEDYVTKEVFNAEIEGVNTDIQNLTRKTNFNEHGVQINKDNLERHDFTILYRPGYKNFNANEFKWKTIFDTNEQAPFNMITNSYVMVDVIENNKGAFAPVDDLQQNVWIKHFIAKPFIYFNRPLLDSEYITALTHYNLSDFTAVVRRFENLTEIKVGLLSRQAYNFTETLEELGVEVGVAITAVGERDVL